LGAGTLLDDPAPPDAGRAHPLIAPTYACSRPRAPGGARGVDQSHRHDRGV